MFPIVCPCGNVISEFEEEYYNRVNNGEHPGRVLDSLGINKYCCRQIFLSNVDKTREYLLLQLAYPDVNINE